MGKIKLGIIGLGYIGQVHMQNAMRISNAEVVAAADTSPKVLEKAKALGVKGLYADYKDLLHDPQVDAVIVSLPTHLHLNCARQAAEAKKDIFLEKPIAVTVEDAKEVLAVAQRNQVKLMLGYPLRFSQEFMQAKQDMDNGLIGDVENVHATYISSGPFFHRADGHSPVPVPDWWFNSQLTGGGVLIDLGCHMINLLRWFFGEIVDIQGQFGHRFNMDFDDSAICLARFESGSLAVINVGWFSQEYLLRVDFLGSVKNVSVEHMPESRVKTLYQMLTKGMSTFTQPHLNELQYFADSIANDLNPSPAGIDGLKDLEAIYKAYKNPIKV